MKELTIHISNEIYEELNKISLKEKKSIITLIEEILGEKTNKPTSKIIFKNK